MNKYTYRFTEIGYATGSENKFIINDGAKYVFEVTANDDGTVTVSKPSDAENNADYEAAKSQVTVYNYAPDVDKDVKDRVNVAISRALIMRLAIPLNTK